MKLTREEFERDYWRYYLLLEEKFKQTIGYVELVELNFKTYSIEYAYLLQSIGGELDTMFKVFCGLSLERASNISTYRRMINKTYSEITTQKVRVLEFDVDLLPFALFEAYVPEWWKAYNAVKHNRAASMPSANQKNVLNILSALYLLEMKYFKNIAAENGNIDRPEEDSKVFELCDWKFNSIPNADAFARYMQMFTLDTKT